MNNKTNNSINKTMSREEMFAEIDKIDREYILNLFWRKSAITDAISVENKLGRYTNALEIDWGCTHLEAILAYARNYCNEELIISDIKEIMYSIYCVPEYHYKRNRSVKQNLVYYLTRFSPMKRYINEICEENVKDAYERGGRIPFAVVAISAFIMNSWKIA